MKIAQRDIDALKVLGYGDHEARFLYIVATHSGYFVPRQFVALSGVKWGYKTDQFTKKLVSRGHASWREYQGTGGVYHLFSKLLYGEIGKENLRNRRRHSVEFIKTRLVLLDFILANQQHDYLETEHQKVQYFCGQLEVPKTSLPAKAYTGQRHTEPTLRYFVDKYPLFFETSDSSSPPVVTFSYVDPGHVSVTGFANHLKAYDPLFKHLRGFRFVYISNSTANFLAAEQCFRSRVKVGASTGPSADVLRYFRLRKAWDLKKYGLFSNDDIECLNTAAQRFRASGIEDVYSAWLSGAISDEALSAQFSDQGPQRTVEFSAVLIAGGRFDASFATV